MVGVEELTKGQFDLVYNSFSFVVASMLFATLFLLVSLPRVLPRYRQAVAISAMVTGIAAYHYLRIFANFQEAYVTDAVGGQGTYRLAEGVAFNELYRYVDWFLTVPLLLVETVAILALARQDANRLLIRLVPASALMIALGYPGEIATDNLTRGIWGALSTIPFLYILWVLFGELTRSIERQPAPVVRNIKNLRWVLVATWGVYPIAYLFPMVGFDGADAFVLRNVGYAIADVVAKAVFGLLIYKIARKKSFFYDAAFEASEMGSAVDPAPAGQRQAQPVA